MTFKIDDKIPDVCCQGYNWDIFDINPDPDPDIIATYWGRCDNPNCPVLCGCGETDCIWDGVKVVEHDSIEHNITRL